MLWAFLSSLVVASPVTLVDRVVADVEGELVLMSDVAREALLAEMDPGGTPFWDPAWRTPEDRLIDAAIVRAIAAAVRLYEPSRQDVQRRVEAIRAQFADRRAWRTFLDQIAADESRLEVIVRRRLVVDRYLSRNLLVAESDRKAFQSAAALHLEQLRQAMRVRRIPPVSVSE